MFTFDPLASVLESVNMLFILTSDQEIIDMHEIQSRLGLQLAGFLWLEGFPLLLWLWASNTHAHLMCVCFNSYSIFIHLAFLTCHL
ncbi:hypothetical protein HanXRQr2_Chr11g0496931 [Helianthus annuus]|uniref:Uncharacterized protein n=1 Tax=Helianthus annuus TaxID=4232 RepID=A0A9K3HQL7_HELAN|nr:hypothetical protein HanXRQr2_Chr11g0496931 [Helianthus annuus]KAJ0875658.1 hypothetical protein HanPSC8_Chr11g0478971 [Helianthus annuus]